MTISPAIPFFLCGEHTWRKKEEENKLEQQVVNCPHCGKITSKDFLAGKKRPNIKCPQCGPQRIYKAGLRYTINGKTQRYLCRDCHYRF